MELGFVQKGSGTTGSTADHTMADCHFLCGNGEAALALQEAQNLLEGSGPFPGLPVLPTKTKLTFRSPKPHTAVKQRARRGLWEAAF